MHATDITQLTNLVLGLWFPFVRIMAFIRYVPVFDNAARSSQTSGVRLPGFQTPK